MRLLLIVVGLPIALWMLAPALAGGQPVSSRIDRERRALETDRARAGVLVTEIRASSERVRAARTQVTRLRERRAVLDRELGQALAALSQVQDALRAQRARVSRLRTRLAEGRTALSKRLVDIYKADDPDVLTVVLESDGFADLMERGEFARRVAEQDRLVIDRVTAARAVAAAEQRRLTATERQVGEAAALIERRRDALRATEDDEADRQSALERERRRKVSLLADVRQRITNTEEDLTSLERTQRRVQARLAQNAAPPTSTRGSGSFIWPTDGTVTSGFGQRWGRLHAGLDIAVPEGTPVRATAAGRVELSAWTGGYGNYVCVQHDNGVTSCYAHNSRLVARAGQRVAQGQLIAASGNTGNSTGPHVHFETRVGGAPRDPLAYL